MNYSKHFKRLSLALTFIATLMLCNAAYAKPDSSSKRHIDKVTQKKIEHKSKHANIKHVQAKHVAAAKSEKRSKKIAEKKRSAHIVKMSKSGICHDYSSKHYARTKHFTEFHSMKACLKAGGRLPKK
ncbi:hypothetical protein [Maridesulfovibrio zosterae]|uniref:hypothetical protein n=1 Tax=Maridesulfovibrio zosterae TaxID=82171 RepID=UPI0012EC8B01|nr:hypothetical protein [Maridesulfovibrio zosterae]